MFRGYLSDFKETYLAVVVDDGTTLDVGFGLVGDFHDEFGAGFDHVFEDGGVDGGTEVVDVGDEDVLDALFDEAVQLAALVEGVVDIAVTGRVPAVLGVVGVLRDWQGGVLFDAGEATLLEGDNVNVAVLVLADDFGGFCFGVEGIHEEEGQTGGVVAV